MQFRSNGENTSVYQGEVTPKTLDTTAIFRLIRSLTSLT